MSGFELGVFRSSLIQTVKAHDQINPVYMKITFSLFSKILFNEKGSTYPHTNTHTLQIPVP